MDHLTKVEPWLIKYSSKNIILVGDLNAKHSLWGGQRAHSRGEILLDFINNHDLTILNEPSSPPTYDSVSGQSWIDLILFKNLGNNLSNFKVHDELSLSDHRLLTFKLVYQGSRKSYGRMNLNRTRKWKLGTDISHMFDLINLELDKNDPDKLIDMATESAKNIYSSNMIKSFKKRKDAIWWDLALEVERKRARALRRRYQSELDINKRIKC